MKKLFIYIAALLWGTVLFGQNDSYYSLINPSSTSFITDLQTRIRSPYTKIIYDNFDETNVANFASRDTTGGQRVVTCVYSGQNYVYSTPFAWGEFSREHTWCHSWMPTYPSKTGDEYSDQHHLFPTNQNNANGVRNNHPLGEVTTITSSYLSCLYGKNSSNQNVFEPKEGHKGDAARALLYMCVKYNGIRGDWSFNTLNTSKLPSLGEAPQDLNQLIAWHLADPPDKWEVERNDYIESIQKNRNPFVDHPEYVNYINFNNVTKISHVYAAEPTNFPTNLTATLNGNTITLSWTEAVAGTQAPSGYLIVAYDKDTYFIPADSSEYTPDTDLSDGKAVVYVNYSDPDSYEFSGINPAKYYYFTVYSYNRTTKPINYKIGGNAPQVNTILPVVEPSNYPTNLTINNPHYTGFTVNWDDAVGTNLPDGYLILVNKTGTFENPVDGTTYNSYVNAELGEAVEYVNYNSLNYYTINGLTEYTNYYVKVFSYAGSGSLINYKTDGTPPTASATTLSIPEPSNFPTNPVISEITATSFKVTWDEATGTTLPDGYWIMINTTGNFTAPIDGAAAEDDTELDDGIGTVHVNYVDDNNYTFNGLTSSTTYYVKIYTYCGDNFSRNYNTDGTAPVANGTTTSISTYTVSLLDDFNRTNSNDLGNNALGFAWNKVETVIGIGMVSINTNRLLMKSLSTSGKDRAYLLLSNIQNYPTTLSNATKLVTWSFNIRQTRDDPSGFDSGNYGTAFILAASSSDITTANGYAVIVGNSGTPNPIKLVYFTSGIIYNSKITPFIVGSSDVSKYYASIKVTYNPSNNIWTLYGELNTSSFPKTDTRLTNTLIGSSTNVSFTNVNLPYLMLLYNHANGADESSIFDDIYVSNPENMLPVELHSFGAIRNNDKVILNWQTDTEINNLGFEIQKQNGDTWEKVGFVNGKGNSNVKNEYSFTDINKSIEKTAYRLKQIDTDGHFSFSEIVYSEGFLINLDYKLYQNYPNPFNPSTTIKYQILNDGLVTIKLYDILGNEIKTLVKEQKTKGQYTYKFESTNLAAGVYIYSLESGYFSESKKMIVLK